MSGAGLAHIPRILGHTPRPEPVGRRLDSYWNLCVMNTHTQTVCESLQYATKFEQLARGGDRADLVQISRVVAGEG